MTKARKAHKQIGNKLSVSLRLSKALDKVDDDCSSALLDRKAIIEINGLLSTKLYSMLSTQRRALSDVLLIPAVEPLF